MPAMKKLMKLNSPALMTSIIINLIYPTHLFAETSEVNQSTSRFLRTKYMCQLAMEDGKKPLPIGLDHFRMSRSHYGIADLYGDGNLDMFFGFSDDTFPIDRVNEGERYLYAGNQERSANNHQYSFYSEDPNFVVPDGTKYLIGRSFAVQDYNGDKIDDYIVAHWGSDYPPQTRRSNELLMSTDSGYKASLLPGGPGHNHSVASGDIDEDGDVDAVVSQPTIPGRLLFYVNDGKGSFGIVQKVGIPLEDKNYGGGAVGLWDVDHDGLLDLLVSTLDDDGDGFHFASIYWGKIGFEFDPEPSQLTIPENEVRNFAPVVRNGEEMATAPAVLDFEFADFGGGKGAGIAVILEEGFYSAWSMIVLNVQNRVPEVFYTDHSPEGQRYYMPWISACDLKGDDDMDLVYDHFGQHFPYGTVNTNPNLDIHRLDKMIWENEGGEIRRRMIEGSTYFDKKFQPLLNAYAASMGVSSTPYVPAQRYFANDLTADQRFVHPGYELHYLPEYRYPYEVDPDIAAQFVDVLTGYGAKKSVATTPNLNNVSPKVKEILERRKKEAAGD
jgi:FG-GAP-like repeat